MFWTRKTSKPIRGTVWALALVGLAALFSIAPGPAETSDDTRVSRFEYLSQNGNSNCSAQFLTSIAAMPTVARLQGSCCSPMDAHRYVEQVEGLKKYNHISAIPSDPYDIAAGLAQVLLPHYELQLSATEQAAYDFAMANSDEKGPCCCGCWRWKVYGGLAKLLIREHNFSGEQVAEIWDLSDGCGGSEDHNH